MGWQDAVAVAVVFGAGFYLSSLGWKGLIGGRSSSCGTSCGKCSSGAETTYNVGTGRHEQLVSIGLPRVASPSQAATRRPERSENP